MQSVVSVTGRNWPLNDGNNSHPAGHKTKREEKTWKMDVAKLLGHHAVRSLEHEATCDTNLLASWKRCYRITRILFVQICFSWPVLSNSHLENKAGTCYLGFQVRKMSFTFVSAETSLDTYCDKASLCLLLRCACAPIGMKSTTLHHSDYSNKSCT